jgi:hypothetical protein
MFRRIPQPPVDRDLRLSERRQPWCGLAFGLMGVALAALGATRLTTIETLDGNPARETEIVKACAMSGIRYVEEHPPSPPVPTGDPAQHAIAMQQWERDIAAFTGEKMSIRVDTGAATPCPT